MLFAPGGFPQEVFSSLVNTLFERQYARVRVYRVWVDAVTKLKGADLAPPYFLPVQAFKTEEVYDFDKAPEKIFVSSGTTGTPNARHYIASLEWYRRIVLEGFRRAVGPAEAYRFFFLLPGYLDRPDASLVHMAQFLHEAGGSEHNPYFKHNIQALTESLEKPTQEERPTVLMGVTYALMDLALTYKNHSSNLIIIETGGMKRQGPEVSKEELKNRLREAFPNASIMSEYGMTELHSQAYAFEDGLFRTPPWMRVQVQDTEDPLAPAKDTGEGRLLITDLANIHSCAFVATEDVGEVLPDGSFRLKGRLHASDLRGCHLMMDH